MGKKVVILKNNLKNMNVTETHGSWVIQNFEQIKLSYWFGTIVQKQKLQNPSGSLVKSPVWT